MKNRICIFIALILLNHSILLPLLASEAEADTNVTITFAAGGVAVVSFSFSILRLEHLCYNNTKTI